MNLNFGGIAAHQRMLLTPFTLIRYLTRDISEIRDWNDIQIQPTIIETAHFCVGKLS
jgi:hypothetical protein